MDSPWFSLKITLKKNNDLNFPASFPRETVLEKNYVKRGLLFRFQTFVKLTDSCVRQDLRHFSIELDTF